MKLERSSGVILHPTSLAGAGGVGCLGGPARRFIDRLQSAQQRWWQVLPLNPPGHGGSPYSATSAFAGSPILLDPKPLVRRGWLAQEDSSKFEAQCEKIPSRRYNIDEVGKIKGDLLERAAHNWQAEGGGDDEGFRAFCDEHDGLWLDDYALFAALKKVHDQAEWQKWPAPLVRRDPEALQGARRRLADSIRVEKFLQWQFFEQWTDLREYAAERGVRLLGDLPIFVAMDSADAWARRDLFELDAAGEAMAVAGVPPDYFSETGQRWGNPLYDWEAIAAEDYRWWVARVAHVMKTVDLVRVDHFRGFEAYWRIPAEEETAVNGEWVDGPKDAIFDAIRRQLGKVPFVAEDLGTITDEVYELRDRHGLPGMRVLQFAFDGDPEHPFLPHNYPEHTVAYTGTHDNDTTRGWYDGLSEEEKHRVRTYLAHPDEGIVWRMIEELWQSKAATVIVPFQDLFELGSEHRMNTPGVAEDNWQWRMTEEELSDEETFQRLGQLTEATGRRQGEA